MHNYWARALPVLKIKLQGPELFPHQAGVLFLTFVSALPSALGGGRNLAFGQVVGGTVWACAIPQLVMIWGMWWTACQLQKPELPYGFQG